MSASIAYVIRGGRVIDGSGERLADVAVGTDGRVAAVAPSIQGHREVDASGCVVAPGFVDLNARIGSPGDQSLETVESLSACAVLGGFTAVVILSTDDLRIDSTAGVREVIDLARTARCPVVPAGSVTVGRQGEQLTPMAELAALGVRYFVDDGVGVQSDRVLRRAMEYASDLEVTVGQHCEVAELALGGHVHEGPWSSRLGLPGIPAEAEELAVARALVLARLTGVRLHLQHLSTAASLAMVRGAREAGLRVTAEVTPHHFTLADSAVAEFDPLTKVHPPLRPDADVAAVRAAICDGLVDALVSDHAPCSADAKELSFDQAPHGAIGLETVLGLAGALDAAPEVLFSALSSGPAAIAGLDATQGGPIAVGREANLAIVDPLAEWFWSAESSASLSLNSPYAGRTLRGRVRHTIIRGRLQVFNFALTDPSGRAHP